MMVSKGWCAFQNERKTRGSCHRDILAVTRATHGSRNNQYRLDVIGTPVTDCIRRKGRYDDAQALTIMLQT